MTGRPRWHDYAAAARVRTPADLGKRGAGETLGRGEPAGLSQPLGRSQPSGLRGGERLVGLILARARAIKQDRGILSHRDASTARLDLRLAGAALTGWLLVLGLLRASAGVSLSLAGFCSGAALVLAGWLVLRRRRGKQLGLLAGTALLLVCLLALLSLVTGVRLAERLSGPIAETIGTKAYVTVELVATSDAARSRAPSRFGGERYLVSARIVSAAGGGRKFEAATPVLVLGSEAWKSVRYADRIRTAGTLTASEPGSAEQALLNASAAPAAVGSPASAETVNRIRAAFIVMTRPLPEDARGLLPGMAFGDREQQTDELADAMRRTGLTHLLAVSGANCSYLLGFVFLLAQSCRVSRWCAAVCGVAALVGFVMLVRPEPSVLRAAVMGAVGVAALLTGRRRASLTFLSVAVLLLLVADPWLAGEYSFILSVLATLGLVLFGSRCSEWLQRWLLKPLADAMAVPIAAQVFCTPVLVLLRPELALYSVPANILAAPVVPIVTITAMAALALLPLLPLVAGWLVYAAGLPTLWVAWIARTFSELPFAALPWLQGGAGSLAAAAAGGGVLLALCLAATWNTRREGQEALAGRARSLMRPCLRLRSIVRAARRPGRRTVRGPALRVGRRKDSARLAAWTLAPALAVGSLAGWLDGQSAGSASADRWDVAACDVGQGDGIVIRTGPSRAMVIDAGPEPGPMDTCLDQLGIESVGTLVLTHMHLDHYGGMAGVFDGREVGSVLLGSAKPDLPGEVTAELRRQGITPERGAAGRHGAEGSASWSVLWPTKAGAGGNENDSSIVLLVEVRAEDGAAFRLLLTGDLESEAAGVMLRGLGGQAPVVDLLKVSHHGARNGGTNMLERLQPRAALISVGKDNDYGHPAPEILSALSRHQIPVFRTDVIGTVLVELRDGRMLVTGLP
ncbi:ComEC/Rec2 family competence protein [Arthrobacter sp. Marseille-P9274]|uniref:ComEC/Rec2 family competence protein n=1 Tax=Arthrobacter sp. Marseille-P9274 TaxID=2866572 RepID=UPI0021C68D7E|nr:ComEC/Rec2 family competence protein [Arthrobacter sp. Marseille-P9274]